MSQVKKSAVYLDQGEGGGGRTKANGSHTTPASDVTKRGPTGSPTDQYRGFRGPKANGSQYVGGNNVPSSDLTSVRGGGGINGHSRNKVAGKSSGSKNAQNPNVNAKDGGASGTYLGK